MEHIGIDVHKKESQICILTEGGELLERRVPTQGRRFAEELGARPHARIPLESATESEWVARCSEGLGHEVIVADPNFAPMYATCTRKVKTDRRDARALAEACLLGAYRPAHRLSDAQRHVRARRTVRETLVWTRTRYISLVRALLRQHGWPVPTGSAEGFGRRVMTLPLPGRLRSEVAPLLAVMRHLQQQLAYSDEQIAAVSMLRLHDPRTAALREWAGRLAARRGKGIAVVALGRRLAGILFALLRDGTVYESRQRALAAMPQAVSASRIPDGVRRAISRRFDGWVSANVARAAVAEPSRR